MTDNDFWHIIESAKTAAGADTDARPSALGKQLQQLPLESIQAFQHCYDTVLQQAYRWDLWGAAYVMNGGCSDDGFRYFCDWLISEGRARFESALADPDSLSELPTQSDFDLESFGYEAVEAFEAKGGGTLERGFAPDLSTHPAGAEWSEDDLPRLFPRLAAKYLG